MSRIGSKVTLDVSDLSETDALLVPRVERWLNSDIPELPLIESDDLQELLAILWERIRKLNVGATAPQKSPKMELYLLEAHSREYWEKVYGSKS